MNTETNPIPENEAPAIPGVGKSYGLGWKLFVEHAGIFLLMTLLYLIIRLPCEIMDDVGKIRAIPGWLGLMSLAFGILVVLPMEMSFGWAFLKAVRKEAFGVKDLAAVFSRNYWPAVGAGALRLIILILGLILLVLPGLYLAGRLSFVTWLIVDRRMGVGEAFRESWAMTRPHQWTLFGIVALSMLIFIGGFLLLGVGLLPAIAWLAATHTIFYHRVETREPGSEVETEVNNSGILVLCTGIALFMLFGMFAFSHPHDASAQQHVPISQTPVEYNGHYYQVFEWSGGIDWKDAKAECEKMGGHLVIINDAAENDFLTSIGAGKGLFHLGASEISEGEWRWVDGTPLSYANWAPGEPNNFGGGNEENLMAYASLWPGWVDGPTRAYGFICEWDRPPESYVAPVSVSLAPVPYGEHFYQIFDIEQPLSWQDAKTRCERLGGHLVIINDAGENAFLATLGAGKALYHLGASDREKEGDWRWVDGTPLGYTNWQNGEPNNANGNEDYLIADPELWPKWNDLQGGARGFICEWNANPERTEVEEPLPENPGAEESANPSVNPPSVD